MSGADAPSGAAQLERLNAIIEHIDPGSPTPGPLMPFSGVVKANIAVAGHAWHGASPALHGVVATDDAHSVARVRAAGGRLVAITNMHELAFGITSANPTHGDVRNPHDPTRMAGGSSGGSAAAVAAGVVDFGLGTDTGGSGRLPAALCGCLGFRPSTGRYPADGVITLSTSFDTVAVLARDVHVLAAVDAVLAGAEETAPSRLDRRVRVGLVRNPLWQGVHDVVARTVEAALRGIPGDLIELVEVDTAPLLEEVDAHAIAMVLVETGRAFRDLLTRLDRDPDLRRFADTIASPDVRATFQAIADGHVPSADAYVQQRHATLTAARQHLLELLSDYELDVLAHPTAPVVAPRLGTDVVYLDGEQVPLFGAMTRRALLASAAGAPAVALPCGRPGGLPVSVELLGQPGADRALLGITAALHPRL